MMMMILFIIVYRRRRRRHRRRAIVSNHYWQTSDDVMHSRRPPCDLRFVSFVLCFYCPSHMYSMFVTVSLAFFFCLLLLVLL